MDALFRGGFFSCHEGEADTGLQNFIKAGPMYPLAQFSEKNIDKVFSEGIGIQCGNTGPRQYLSDTFSRVARIHEIANGEEAISVSFDTVWDLLMRTLFSVLIYRYADGIADHADIKFACNAGCGNKSSACTRTKPWEGPFPAEDGKGL